MTQEISTEQIKKIVDEAITKKLEEQTKPKTGNFLDMVNECNRYRSMHVFETMTEDFRHS